MSKNKTISVQENEDPGTKVSWPWSVVVRNNRTGRKTTYLYSNKASAEMRRAYLEGEMDE